MDKSTRKALEDKVRDSEVSKDQRKRLIKSYNLVADRTRELADIFDVSMRQIQYDKKGIKEEMEGDIKDYSLVGELFSQYHWTMDQMTKAIEQGDYKKVNSLKKRWSVTKSFTGWLLPVQLEEIIDTLEAIPEGDNVRDVKLN